MSESFIAPPALIAFVDPTVADDIVEPGDSANRAVRANVVASIAVPVSGTVTANQGTPNTTANRWPVQITDGTDLALVTAAGEVNVLAAAQPGVNIGNVTVANAAPLGVTATGAVGAAVTLTIPAAGVGLFHFITRSQITADTAVVALGANASAVVTSTNLPGNPAWNLLIMRNGGGIDREEMPRVYPLRSSVANTATTIVAPATANTIWRINVEYFTAT